MVYNRRVATTFDDGGETASSNSQVNQDELPPFEPLEPEFHDGDKDSFAHIRLERPFVDTNCDRSLHVVNQSTPHVDTALADTLLLGKSTA